MYRASDNEALYYIFISVHNNLVLNHRTERKGKALHLL